MKNNKVDWTISNEMTCIKRMNYLRGLFAVLIVLGHCSMQFEKEVLPLLIIHKFNMVAVGFFFLVSGWSLSYNFYNKKDYQKGFMVKKGLKLFIYALISEIVSAILYSVFLSLPLKLNWTILLDFNWYIYEMLFFYVIFYVAYKIKWGKNLRVLFVWAFSFLLSVIALYLSNRNFWVISSWYYSSLCFAWGITIHEYYDFFKKALYKKIIISIILLLLSLASCISLKMPRESFIGGVVLHNAIGICVMSVIAIWAHIVNFTKIPILDRVTAISTEIYLYQFVLLEVASELFARKGFSINMLYVLIVLTGTFILAFAMHFINKQISKVISFDYRVK